MFRSGLDSDDEPQTKAEQPEEVTPQIFLTHLKTTATDLDDILTSALRPNAYVAEAIPCEVIPLLRQFLGGKATAEAVRKLITLVHEESMLICSVADS